MKHSISIYDSGKNGSYSRRNDGFIFASILAGIILAITGAIMMLSVLDPTVPAGLLFPGLVAFVAPFLNGAMFLTHRNFGLNERATNAMDAIYSLPKEERKQYNITRDEVKSLSSNEAYEMQNAIDEYLRRNRAAGGNAVGTLIANITEYNKTARQLETME